MVEQFAVCGTVVGEDRRTDTAGNDVFDLTVAVRILEYVAELRQAFFEVFLRDAVGEYDEFVTAVTCDDIGMTEYTEDPLCDPADDVVADDVTERVVDLLEVVDIDKYHCRGGNGIFFECIAGGLLEELAVIKTRECVAVCLFLPAVDFVLPARDIDERTGDHGFACCLDAFLVHADFQPFVMTDGCIEAQCVFDPAGVLLAALQQMEEVSAVVLVDQLGMMEERHRIRDGLLAVQHARERCGEFHAVFVREQSEHDDVVAVCGMLRQSLLLFFAGLIFLDEAQIAVEICNALEFVDGHGLEVIEALNDVAGCLLQILDLAGIIDAFRNGLQLHLRSKLEDRFDGEAVAAAVVFMCEEAAVQLDGIDVQLAEEMQRNGVLADVIERAAEAVRMDLLDDFLLSLQVKGEEFFGKLEFDQPGLDGMRMAHPCVDARKVLDAEAFAGKVDGNGAGLFAFALPCGELLADGVEQISVDEVYHLVFFQHGDEHIGSDGAAHGVSPADERLCADDAVIAKADLGLHINDKITGLQRVVDTADELSFVVGGFFFDIFIETAAGIFTAAGKHFRCFFLHFCECGRTLRDIDAKAEVEGIGSAALFVEAVCILINAHQAGFDLAFMLILEQEAEHTAVETCRRFEFAETCAHDAVQMSEDEVAFFAAEGTADAEIVLQLHYGDGIGRMSALKAFFRSIGKARSVEPACCKIRCGACLGLPYFLDGDRDQKHNEDQQEKTDSRKNPCNHIVVHRIHCNSPN